MAVNRVSSLDVMKVSCDVTINRGTCRFFYVCCVSASITECDSLRNGVRTEVPVSHFTTNIRILVSQMILKDLFPPYATGQVAGGAVL